MSSDTEREAFEAYLKRLPTWAPEFDKHRGWVDVVAWDVWQARAAIAVQPPAASQPSDREELPALPSKRRSFICTKCGSHEATAGQEHMVHPLCTRCDYLGFADDIGYSDDEMHAYARASIAVQPPAASQPIDGLESVFRQLDERAREHAESHDREENEYAAGITDALTMIRAELAAVQGKK